MLVIPQSINGLLTCFCSEQTIEWRSLLLWVFQWQWICQWTLGSLWCQNDWTSAMSYSSACRDRWQDQQRSFLGRLNLQWCCSHHRCYSYFDTTHYYNILIILLQMVIIIIINVDNSNSYYSIGNYTCNWNTLWVYLHTIAKDQVSAQVQYPN